MGKLLDEGFSAGATAHGTSILSLRPSLNEPRKSWEGAGACLAGAPPPPPKQPPGLPGWGLVLGAFAQEFRASRAIELAKQSVGLSVDIGLPKIIRLKDAKFYGALLVGLDEHRAMAACGALRRNGAYCVMLDPRELNDPGARWRY